jgi:hypothetical protein
MRLPVGGLSLPSTHRLRANARDFHKKIRASRGDQVKS